MVAAIDDAGNPSSIHAEGRAARAIVEEARRAGSRAGRGRAARVVFVSGGDRGRQLALEPALRLRAGKAPSTG